MKITTTALALITSAYIAVVATVSLAADSKSEREQVQANLKRFDQLDFDAYSQRKDMKLFEEIHCADVKVVFPDGRTTHGIHQHKRTSMGFSMARPIPESLHIPSLSDPVIGRQPQVF